MDILNSIFYNMLQIGTILYKTQIPSYGYLFISTTFLMFIFEIKHCYKSRRLEQQIRVLEERLKEV